MEMPEDELGFRGELHQREDRVVGRGRVGKQGAGG